MIDITRLLCGTVHIGDALRYAERSEAARPDMLRFALEKKPVVVWNMTRQCNLSCVHCYAHAKPCADPDELTTREARALIDDLGQFGAPVLLFSGGEPFVRPDLYDLGRNAIEHGIRAVISTNGTLITEEAAVRVKEVGFSYVGVSLDGGRNTNDRFRGQPGAFDAALQGIRNCHAAGVKAGLRFTVNKRNVDDLPEILDLLEEERIVRCCVYHLVYAGRGTRLMDEDLSAEETRRVMDLLMERAVDFHQRGLPTELLTVDNHADGVYLYLRLRERDPERAEEVLALLRRNGGNSSGVGIGDVDQRGDVHADQFWTHHTFGNVRERPFSQIWTDLSDPIMAGLKNRRPLLKGRCGACKWQDICNGNFRVRAEAVYGDVWAQDPACYMTDEEIGIA